MPYNFIADGFHTKQRCSSLSYEEVQFQMENSHFAFLSPPLGSYGQHTLFLLGSLKSYPVMLMELFLLGVTAEALQAKINCKLACSKELGHFDPKFQVQGVMPQEPFFLSDLLYEIRILAVGYFVS